MRLAPPPRRGPFAPSASGWTGDLARSPVRCPIYQLLPYMDSMPKTELPGVRCGAGEGLSWGGSRSHDPGRCPRAGPAPPPAAPATATAGGISTAAGCAPREASTATTNSGSSMAPSRSPPSKPPPPSINGDLQQGSGRHSPANFQDILPRELRRFCAFFACEDARKDDVLGCELSIRLCASLTDG